LSHRVRGDNPVDDVGLVSALRMSGDRTANYEIKDVPHGALTQVWYSSPTLNLSANSKLHLLYVHIGAEDGLITVHNLIKDQMKAKGINATVIETHGYGHEWPFWRAALEDYTPRLFQAAAK
jgi:S-formylglutathione hydrolase FrmB